MSRSVSWQPNIGQVSGKTQRGGIPRGWWGGFPRGGQQSAERIGVVVVGRRWREDDVLDLATEGVQRDED